MDNLWAPWRTKYVIKSKTKGCIFCSAKRNPEGKFVLYKNKYSIAILNIFPYNNGHVMIAPLRHISTIEKLNDDELLDIMKKISLTVKITKKILKPQGFNIGVNIGKSAGAGIASHIHIHIVPRWEGDTNFMPIISGTKVIPQSLKEFYRRVKPFYQK